MRLPRILALMFWVAGFILFSLKLAVADIRQENTQDSGLKKIYACGPQIHKAQNLFHEFRLGQSENAFEDALTGSEKCEDEMLRRSIESDIIQIYFYQERYQDGLDRIASLYRGNSHPLVSSKIKKYQVALIYQQTTNKQAVYEFIEEYKEQHKNEIPPKRAGATEMSTIAELYDLIGDYDAGIQWAKMFKKKISSKRRRQEYDELIRAFEESKQGMPKVCSDDGKYCVGRATAVIIRSKYF